MKETYTVKYRKKWSFTWKKKVKNVKESGFFEGMFWFKTEDGELIYLSSVDVWFPRERQEIIARQISRDIGQPVQMK